MDDQSIPVGIIDSIFSQVRTTIVMSMRFLDVAAFRLKPVPSVLPLATDGEFLYHSPRWLTERYCQEENGLSRDFLHVLLHCIFRHPFVGRLVDHALWDLACDIAVEGLICEMNIQYFATEQGASRGYVVDALRSQVRPLTAEKLYNHFQNRAPAPAWRDLFHVDVHDLWYMQQTKPSRRPQVRDERDSPANEPEDDVIDGSDEQATDQSQERDDEGAPKEGGQAADQSEERDDEGAPKEGAQAADRVKGRDGERSAGRTDEAKSAPGLASPGGQTLSRRDALEREWRDISERVQMDIESFTRQHGLEAGSLTQQLSALNRERYDYGEFLKKFAVSGEAMKINDDEFDYIFYTYGLKLFGNMPLIEPLEYKEDKRIREFVIAIDTSRSTSGELVTRFLNKTYNILMSTESFFSRVNIHIIQCDAAIQEAVKITCREDFRRYISGMQIRGQGGTDFRPVFEHVDSLIREGEFQNLKGLVYFTDGYGEFPLRKPAYQTAFVFIREAYSNVDVPPWAIRLVLEEGVDEL